MMRTGLVLEPSPFKRHALRRLLRGIGFERVLEAGSPADAVALLSAQPVAVVLLAWPAGTATGLELVRALRRSKHHRRPAIVVLDEGLPQATIVAAIKAGAIGRLTAPWDGQALRRLLASQHGADAEVQG
ncbi:MAG: response regulator [Candidatus Lambdaproteobacteria bacterium]|nr:response regulator [Candidatus Lambdaproteobacteria bacterium]